MKKYYIDKVILFGIIFLSICIAGSLYNGNFIEFIIEFAIYFLPGMIILFVLNKLLRNIYDDFGATFRATIYIIIVMFLTMIFIYPVPNFAAIILLGCFAQRIFRCGTFIRTAANIDNNGG